MTVFYTIEISVIVINIINITNIINIINILNFIIFYNENNIIIINIITFIIIVVVVIAVVIFIIILFIIFITDEIGVNLFLSSGTVSLTPSLSCLKWVAQQKPKITSLLRYSFLLPPCPCSAFQAMFSPFHFWVPNTNCFMSSVAYYFTAPNFMAMVSAYLSLVSCF